MIEEIRRALKTLYSAGDTVEVRSFGKDGTRRVGRYPLGWDLARAIAAEDEAGQDVYYVLNPTSLPPVPIGPGEGTKEKDVPRRRWFLLDFDPRRENKIATSNQFENARTQAANAKRFMEEEWAGAGLGDEAGIVMASSGNGVHLLVPVDLPNDEPSKRLIRSVQRAIAERFSTAEVEVECFPDAARLVRAYGTLNKKGTETDTLKWRRSGLL